MGLLPGVPGAAASGSGCRQADKALVPGRLGGRTSGLPGEARLLLPAGEWRPLPHPLMPRDRRMSWGRRKEEGDKTIESVLMRHTNGKISWTHKKHYVTTSRGRLFVQWSLSWTFMTPRILPDKHWVKLLGSIQYSRWWSCLLKKVTTRHFIPLNRSFFLLQLFNCDNTLFLDLMSIFVFAVLLWCRKGL